MIFKSLESLASYYQAINGTLLLSSSAAIRTRVLCFPFKYTTIREFHPHAEACLILESTLKIPSIKTNIIIIIIFPIMSTDNGEMRAGERRRRRRQRRWWRENLIFVINFFLSSLLFYFFCLSFYNINLYSHYFPLNLFETFSLFLFSAFTLIVMEIELG